METKLKHAGKSGQENYSSNFNPAKPFVSKSTLATSRFYMGSIMSFLAKGEETGGRLALMEYQAKPGNEPPPHIHEWEHETYYVLEGIMEFYCDGQVFLLHPGDFAFFPKGKAHAFYIRSPHIRVLIGIEATGEHAVGLDRYFLEMSAPTESLSLPKEAVTYVMDDPEHAVGIGARHGIQILTPEETAELLPHFPGFGVPRELIDK
jgi:quercetin dioxygenase-like cupin family protein